jgi:signal transduction histidine kinase
LKFFLLFILLSLSPPLSSVFADSAIRIDRGWQISSVDNRNAGDDGSWRDVDLPCISTFDVDDWKIRARVNLPEFKGKDPVIFIKMLDQPFEVLLDGIEIYRFGELTSQRREFLGLPWHMIPLPENFHGKSILFTVRKSADPKSGLCDEVVLGSRADHIAQMISKNLDIVVLTTVSFMAAFTNLIVALSMRSWKPYVSFSMFAMAIGTWVFSNSSSQIKLFLINKPIFWAWLDFTSLYLIPAFVLLFAYQVFGDHKGKGLLALSIIHFAFTLGASLLSFFGIIDPKSALFPYNCLVPITILVLAIYTVIFMTKKQADAGLIGAGLLLMIGFAVHDLMVGLQVLPWSKHTLQFGLTSMLIPFSIIVVRRIHQILDQQREAEFNALKDRQRAEIMQNLAHDIKNPLAVFELISATNTWEEFLSWKPDMAKAINRIHAIIAGFKKDANEIALKIEVDSLDIAGIASDANKTMGSDKVRIKAESETDLAKLKIDKVALERSIFNLITNAVEAGAHSITIRSKSRANDLFVSVVDDGPGVSGNIIDKLFQRGQSFGKPGGQGIGLFNVRSIVAGHGGTIEYRRENGLSYFEMTLPGSILEETKNNTKEAVNNESKDHSSQQSVLIAVGRIDRQESLWAALANYPLKIYIQEPKDIKPSLVFTDDHELMEKFMSLRVPIIMENGKDDPEKIAKQIVRRLRGRSEIRKVEADRL